MQIYLGNLLVLGTMVFAFQLMFIKLNSRRQTWLMILLFIPVFLLSALRKENIGVDTGAYTEFFSYYANQGQDIFNLHGRFEEGFKIYVYLLSFMSDNPRFFIIVTSFITISLVFIFIKNYSHQPYLSIYLFITLNYYQQTFNTMRQALAMAVILFGIQYLHKRSIAKFAGLLFVAANIHSVAWLLGPTYFFYYVKLTKKKLILIAILGLFFYFSYESLMWVIAHIKFADIGDRYYAYLLGQEGKGRSFIVAIAMFVCSFIILQKKCNWEQNFHLWICLITVCAYLFAMRSLIFIRVAELFAIFFIVLVPNSICAINNKKLRSLAYVFVIILGLAHYYVSGILVGASGTVPYQFFTW